MRLALYAWCLFRIDLPYIIMKLAAQVGDFGFSEKEKTMK